MRSISQCLPVAVLAMLANACERPTAPTSPPVRVPLQLTPTASISDAANGGRLGFYFLPSLVANPGPFSGTFDATITPLEMSWTSANSALATVDADGTVHGHSVGDVTITATCRGVSGSYVLHVVSGPD